MFKLGAVVFTHADVVFKMAPLEGPAKGQPFTLLACSKLEMKMNGKALSVKGNSIIPVAMALAEAEPSFSISLDTSLVSLDYAEHCGGQGYMRMGHNGTITATRPGLVPVTFKLLGMIIENGFGLTSDAGGNTKDDLSGKFREPIITYKGKDYHPFALPGGVNLT
jgi:hypothetical protein